MFAFCLIEFIGVEQAVRKFPIVDLVGHGFVLLSVLFVTFSQFCQGVPQIGQQMVFLGESTIGFQIIIGRVALVGNVHVQSSQCFIYDRFMGDRQAGFASVVECLVQASYGS